MKRKESLKKAIKADYNVFGTNRAFGLHAWEELFKLSDTGVKATLFQNWRLHGLMPLLGEDRSWVRLNFFDYLWVMAVNKMRNIGCSLETIKKVADYLFTEFDINKTKPHIEKAKQELERRGANKETIEQQEEVIGSGKGHQVFEQAGIKMCLFHGVIISCVVKNQRAGVTILDNGLPTEWLEEYLEMGSLAKEIWNRSHIFISFSDLIQEFIDDTSKEKFISYFETLSQNEAEILRSLRKRDFKEITIVPAKGKDTVDIITVKDGTLTEQQEEQISKILDLRNYQNITLKKANGTQVSFEKKHRKRMNIPDKPDKV